MRLYYSDASPYVRKVRVAAYEKGLEPELVKTTPFDNDAEFLKVNPLGKIPALVTREGLTYCDSLVICEYFDAYEPEPILIPHEAEGRLEVLRRDMLLTGVLDAAVKLIMEMRRPEGLEWPLWIKRQEAAIYRTLDMVERENGFLAEPLALHHITAGVSLGYLDFRFDALNWRKGRPKLAAWYEKFAMRPSMQKTMPEGPAVTRLAKAG